MHFLVALSLIGIEVLTLVHDGDAAKVITEMLVIAFVLLPCVFVVVVVEYNTVNRCTVVMS